MYIYIYTFFFPFFWVEREAKKRGHSSLDSKPPVDLRFGWVCSGGRVGWSGSLGSEYEEGSFFTELISKIPNLNLAMPLFEITKFGTSDGE